MPALQALHKSPHQICAVYTQPDRPAGRGRKLTPSAVKQYASSIGCPIVQPVTLRDGQAQAELASFRADVMVVVAYGLILPIDVLKLPKYGCLNIHASLLPRWRGAAPIQRALLAGDDRTGVTIMQMDVGLDTGDILATRSTTINADDTSPILHERLASEGGQALMEVLAMLSERKLTPRSQDSKAAIYAEKLSKQEARLDWSQSADYLHRQIRAFLPWPVAECEWNGQRLRVWEAGFVGEHSDEPPGIVIRADKNGIDVAAGNGVLRLLQVQLPGGKPITAEQFVAAHTLTGQKLR